VADTGTLYPAVVTTAASAPYDDLDWTDPGNVTADDTSYASITDAAYDTGAQSYLMSVRQFGASVPGSATINGVQVEIGKYYAVGAARDAVVQLINGVGTTLGNNLGSVNDTWPTTAPGTIVYGGPANLWGTTLTPAVVNGTAFGVQFAGSAAGNNCDAYVDFIRLIITYTAAGGTAGTITPGEATQAQTSDARTLAAIYPFAPAEATQAQAGDTTPLAVIYPFTPAEATQTQVSDVGAVSSPGTISGPTTGTLDAFNRINGTLGTAWGGPFRAGNGTWRISGSAAAPYSAGTALLEVSSTNARYLVNQDGNPVILVGFHTWYDTQDGGNTDPPPTFGWSEYLTAIQSYGCNFTKLWACETWKDWGGDFPGDRMSPTRYERTGPGTDADGKDKFDLTSINSDYITRMVSRCSDLENAGVYFVVQLFQGWQVESKGGSGSPFDYHPYNSANNINSVDGDDDDDGEGTETHWPTAQGNNTLSYQEDMVEAIIDAVNGYNYLVGYEISNEDTDDASGYNTDWQEYMISHINTYQAGKPKQHLVGMTRQWPDGEDSTLDASGADWVCYSTTKADAVHAATDPVSFYDTDHTVGIEASEYSWIWEAFCNGHGGSWYMDQWYPNMYGVDARNDADMIVIRENLGYLVTQVGLLNDLLGMTPQPSLCSTGYCLAKDHATAAEYICFNVNGSASFTLDLTNATGTLNIRWLKCSDGTLDTDDTVSGGAERTLTNPSGFGVSVAYVRHT